MKFIYHVAVVVSCSETAAGPFPARYGQVPSDQQQVGIPRRRWLPEDENPVGRKPGAQSGQQALTSSSPASRSTPVAGQPLGRLRQLTGQHQVGIEPKSVQRARLRPWDYLWRMRSSTPSPSKSVKDDSQLPGESTGGRNKTVASPRRAGVEPGSAAAAGERGKKTVQTTTVQSSIPSKQEEPHKSHGKEEEKESEKDEDAGSVKSEDKPAGQKDDTEKAADEKGDQPAEDTKDADGAAADAEKKEDELEGHGPAKNEVFVYRVMPKTDCTLKLYCLNSDKTWPQVLVCTHITYLIYSRISRQLLAEF